MKTNGGYSFSDIGHLFALKDRKLDTVDYGCIPIGVIPGVHGLVLRPVLASLIEAIFGMLRRVGGCRHF